MNDTNSNRLSSALAIGFAALLATGCATTTPKPAYPKFEAAEGTSTLKLDNTMADSVWAVQFKAGIGLNITIDGFAPAEKEKLKSGGQIGQRKRLLPKGVTEVSLPAGSHTMVIQANLLGKRQYYFNPVNLTFDTEAGKTYSMRFEQAGTIFKPSFTVQYQGWNTEQTSQWPHEIAIANPLFGR